MRYVLARFVGVACLAVMAGCAADGFLSPRRAPSVLAARVGTPGGQTELTAAPASPSQIDLSWQDNANGETGWEVHRSATGANGAFSLQAQAPAGATNYSDTRLEQSTEYCYKVRSFKRTGKSTSYGPISFTSCATTHGPPRAPTNIRAVPAPYGFVDVTWTFAGITETSARVERLPGASGTWEPAGSVSFRSTSFRDSQRPLDIQVCYRIIAVNSFGESPPSSSACTAPPRPPSNLSTRSVDATSIELSWQDNSEFEDGYAVERARDETVLTWTEIGTVAANQLTYHDAGVISDTRYYYRVRARKDGGYSDYSPWASGATATVPPSTPTGVNAVPNSSTTAYVSWNQGSLTTEGFRVERSTDGGATWNTAGTVNNGPWGSFFDEGLTSDQEVCYRVAAFNGAGESSLSAPDCTAPPAAPTEIEIVSIDDQTVEIRWKDNSSVEDFYELWFEGFCGPYGCYLEPYWYSVTLPANSQSYRMSVTESFYGVLAFHDGGYSDWGTWKDLFAQSARRALGAPSKLLSPGALRRSATPGAKRRQPVITPRIP